MYKFFDPGKGFFDLPVSRWVLGSGCFLTLTAVGIYIASAWSVDRCWSPDCLNYFFLDLMKVPLGVLTFTAATLALMATHHRSKQFAHQSTITNYYTHLKEFRAYMDNWGAKKVTVNSSSKLYQNFFPSVLHGMTDVSEDFLVSYERGLDGIIKALKELHDDKERPSKWYSEKVREIINLTAGCYEPVIEGATVEVPYNFFSIKQGLIPISDGQRSVLGDRLTYLRGSLELVLYVVEFDPYSDLSGVEALKESLEEQLSILTGGKR